eukprot:12159-Heterococcus_DN1.PRE.2
MRQADSWSGDSPDERDEHNGHHSIDERERAAKLEEVCKAVVSWCPHHLLVVGVCEQRSTARESKCISETALYSTG